MALYGRHHRLHHRDQLGISGDADEPGGIVFTDARGRPLASAGTPILPTEPAPTGNWVHPTGERMDDDCVVFSPPPGTAAQVAAANLVGPVRDYPSFIDLDDPVLRGGRRRARRLVRLTHRSTEILSSGPVGCPTVRVHR